jgi:DNA anti-recombination protein RmuC
MATNEKYLNYYIETLTSTLNDCVVRNVSMQANARISNEVIEEQQQKIEELENLLNSVKQNSESISNKLVEENKKLATEVAELRAIRNQYENVKSEAAHIETFRNELVKERESHQSTRSELQIKVNNITNDFNTRINKLNTEHNDKLNAINKEHSEKLNKLNNKHKEEIKLMNDRIAYLEMSPAKRKKFDMMNVKPESVEKVEEETNKDGGVF